MAKIIDNRFELDSEQALAEDAMFQIYKAHDKEYGRSVIIKILKDEYAQESSIVHKFQEYFVDFQTKVRNKKNLAEVSQISGVAGGMVYMVQEYVDGQSLQTFIESHPKMTAKDIAPILEQICEGLHCLHHSKLCHYEVLPRNIIINNNNEVKLVGFGSLYPVLGNNALLNKLTADVEEFIAPEISGGKGREDITSACDIYTVGKILESLPIAKNNNMVSVIGKATESEPERRHQKIREFMAEVEALFAEEPDNVQVKTIKIPGKIIKPDKRFKFRLPIKEERVSSIKSVIAENLPPKFANFDQNKLEFEFIPWAERTEQFFLIKFEVITDTDREIIELPITVEKAGMIPIPPPEPNPRPEPEEGEIIEPEWNIAPPRSFNVNETVRFMIDNPNPKRYRIHLKSRPPAAKAAEFDENSGEFRWNLKKEVGNHIFLFEIIDIDHPSVTWTKQMTLVVNDIFVTPPGGEPIWDVYKKAFFWIYNLIFFITGFFASLWWAEDFIAGFFAVIILEGIYLFFAANNNNFQKFLEKEK